MLFCLIIFYNKKRKKKINLIKKINIKIKIKKKKKNIYFKDFKSYKNGFKSEKIELFYQVSWVSFKTNNKLSHACKKIWKNCYDLKKKDYVLIGFALITIYLLFLRHYHS